MISRKETPSDLARAWAKLDVPIRAVYKTREHSVARGRTFLVICRRASGGHKDEGPLPAPIDGLGASPRVFTLEITAAAAGTARLWGGWSDRDPSYLLQWPRPVPLEPDLLVLQRIPRAGLLFE